MRTIEHVTEVDEARRRAVERLLEAASAASGHDALGEEQRLAFDAASEAAPTSPSSPSRRRPGLQAWLARDGDRLLAYCQLTVRQASASVELARDPTVARDAELDERLLVEALGAARALFADDCALGAAMVVTFWAHRATSADDALAAACGLAPQRRLLQLRRALPLEDALDRHATRASARAFRPGRDEDAFLALNNRAFLGHLEQGGWDALALAARAEQPWFEPGGFLLAEDDAGLAGFCWTKIDPSEPGTGEIYVIAVDPDRQAAGLGTALVAAGCRHLSEAGCSVVSLYVDAANEAALRLYDRLGFLPDHEDRAYGVRLEVARAKARAGPSTEASP